ncbi:uncharacterized protein DUF3667 [Mucilaginibacter oryzae]|uniref:Uncharacterized protein DUF3667 n=1 Tax=Mucilaginibacter oryzae TaxID=468058 RepID=A0A316HJ23_9SPHI|nr:DUF3667 domain-containing protein [Mucilaginibacter oryzae]PWK80496.1 uncharacterized protein DUF3667 [Mucilaginibacter oryzae]
MIKATINCKNCDSTVDGNFCSSCGHPAIIKRVDGHYLLHEIQHVLHFEKGIFYTIRELLIRPGQNVREFLADNRSRMVKPVLFITITSLIYSIINHIFHVEEEYITYKSTESAATDTIFAWIQGHYGYSNIIMGVFIAFTLKLFFRKYNYNFFEILILLCFVIGMGMLIYTVFAFAYGAFKFNLIATGGVIGLCYCVWAIALFFDGRKWINYLKALAAYLLGSIIFMLVALLLGITADILLKH